MKILRKSWPLLICLFAFFFILILLGSNGDSREPAVDRSTYKTLKIFTEILDIVEKNYVEPIEPKTLIQSAISGMMKSLDPHSSFMTPEMYKELEAETKGSFGGIGIEITIQKDILTVVSPIEDTPAFNAGIEAGDQIIKIDGKSTKDITIMEAVNKLRGPKDTKVTITIMRETLTKPKDITITRDMIKVKSVKSKIFDKHIGYLRISSFQERTTDDLVKAFNEVRDKANPMRGLILDMRNNPGGLLNQAVEVSDLFLKSGIIVSTKGRTKTMESKATAMDDGNEPTCPMIVLVNEGSASASEIVAGALQDNGRALIIGTQTFGKGSVQTVIPLEDGAALKLTTAKYYTPKGRSIQAEGITPDIEIKFVRPSDEKEQSAEEPLREKDLKGHIKQPDKAEAKPEEPKSKEADDLTKDNQLKNAIDILKSWEIFQKTN
jgi:carboxyl-terminal processing protease